MILSGIGIGKIPMRRAAPGLPEPVFEESQGFRATFRKAAAHAPEYVSMHATTSWTAVCRMGWKVKEITE